MNKTQIVLELYGKALLGGITPDVPKLYADLRTIESKGVKNGDIQPDVCPKCKSAPGLTDMGKDSENAKIYRFSCDCTKTQSLQLKDVISIWCEKVNFFGDN